MNPINWPTQSRKLSDYSQPFLQCIAFPTLFPYGKGRKSNKHLLKYAIYNEKSENDDNEPVYIYPFAEHDRWINWVQNIN